MRRSLKTLILGVSFILGVVCAMICTSQQVQALYVGEDVTGLFDGASMTVQEDSVNPGNACGDIWDEWDVYVGHCSYFSVGLSAKPGSFIYNNFSHVPISNVPDWVSGKDSRQYYWKDYAYGQYVWRCVHPHYWAISSDARVDSARIKAIDSDGNIWIYVVVRPNRNAYYPGECNIGCHLVQEVGGYIKVGPYSANFESETSVSYNDEDHGTSGRDSLLEAGDYITNPKKSGGDSGWYKIDYIHRLFRVGPNMDKRAENNWVAGRTNGEPDQPSWQIGTQRAGFEVGGQNPQELGSASLKGDVDVGRTERICHSIAHDRNVSMRQDGVYATGGGWRASGACVNVTHLANFELTDDVYFNDDDVIYAGQTAELTADFYNKTAPNPDIVHTSSPEDTKYRQIWFYTDDLDGKKLEGGVTDSDDVGTLCSHFGVAGCQQDVIKGLEGSIPPGDVPKTQRIDFDVDDIDVDTTLNNKLCMAVAVSPYRSEDNGYGVKNQWIISNATCRTIAKKPSIAIQAGNFYAQGAITGATSLKNIDDQKMLFGSWAEYLTLSHNPITKFASGAKLAFNHPGGEVNVCQYAPLSIASSQCANSQATAENVGEATISSSSQFLNNIMSLYKQDKPAGDETIEDVSVKKGQKQIIFVNGDAHIRNNITVGDADIRYYEQPSDVPQVIILARNIKIDPGVTQLDAWLVAYGEQQDGEYKGGEIDTCSGFRLGYGIGPCNTRLIINGPVVAGEFTPWRSGGAKPGLEGSRETAETITLTPAAYEWGYHEASGGDEAQAHTVYSREVAPRL